jgi:hypothetical protein
MSNFSFLLKMSVMQLAFVGLACMVIPALSFLITIELLYTWLNIHLYLRDRHLKNCLLLIPKITQSVLLLILEAILLISFTKLEKKAYAIKESHQNDITKFILISNIIEYVFLLLYIYSIVKDFID